VSQNISFSIIIPAYNEEAIIKKAIEEALDVLNRNQANYEIIVVNDGSTDQTKTIVDTHFSNNPNITLHHKPQNQGFGSAVRTGIQLAKQQYLLCVPADSPLSNDMYTAFAACCHQADIIVGYRVKRVGYSPRMQLNSWVYHHLISKMFGMQLRDYNWVHLYNRKIFDPGKVIIESNGIFMLAEVLIKAKLNGFTFHEIEVEQRERLTGIATAAKLSSIVKTIVEMTFFRLRIK